jgi:hypothetical protein
MAEVQKHSLGFSSLIGKIGIGTAEDSSKNVVLFDGIPYRPDFLSRQERSGYCCRPFHVYGKAGLARVSGDVILAVHEPSHSQSLDTSQFRMDLPLEGSFKSEYLSNKPCATG